MPIFEINNVAFFLTYSDLKEIGLIDKLFDKYNRIVNEDFRVSDIDKVVDFIERKNKKSKYPALFNFNKDELRYAASELLNYAKYRNYKNPNFYYLLSNGDKKGKGKHYYLYPFKSDEPNIQSQAGFILEEGYLHVTFRFHQLKRISGCIDCTVIETESFFIYIYKKKISISLDPFRSFPSDEDLEFRCQGKLTIPSLRGFKKFKWRIFIDRNYL